MAEAGQQPFSCVAVAVQIRQWPDAAGQEAAHEAADNTGLGPRRSAEAFGSAAGRGRGGVEDQAIQAVAASGTAPGLPQAAALAQLALAESVTPSRHLPVYTQITLKFKALLHHSALKVGCGMEIITVATSVLGLSYPQREGLKLPCDSCCREVVDVQSSRVGPPGRQLL